MPDSTVALEPVSAPQNPNGAAAAPKPAAALVPAAPGKLRHNLITAAILALAALVVLAIAGRWNGWIGSRSRQTTDDAYLRSDVTPLSTKSAGIVELVATSDYQRVKAGDVLVQLRDDDFRAQVELAEANVSAARAALENLRKQKELQQSRIALARANLEATGADLEMARLDRIRAESLVKEEATTHQTMEHAVADHLRQQAMLIGRQADIQTQLKQVAVLDAQEAQLKADLRAKEAALKVARVNLDYTRIVAPTDGVLGERKVRPGQLVSAGTQVVSLVGNDVWVIANFKETQLARVQVGDRAEVRVDGVPGVVWTGVVDTISPGTGAQFSLLPPDNATGNFTKIAQRVPVKIVFDPGQREADRLRSGMSAVATILTQR
ncbi:MAG TPA: HlyD family secretion protein [Myxococcales bacterium]|nr:HlyD family secretion protein [Myxococcales bacterium]